MLGDEALTLADDPAPSGTAKDALESTKARLWQRRMDPVPFVHIGARSSRADPAWARATNLTAPSVGLLFQPLCRRTDNAPGRRDRYRSAAGAAARQDL